MDYISEKISKDPVTGKLYVGKKPGDDQAPDAPAANATASATPQPEKKGMNFSLGGVDPTTKNPFLGVQPGRDPADTLTGRLANLFIPRRDKETGRLYMGTQVGRDPKRGSATPAAATPEAEASATATPADGASATATPAAGKSSGATPKLSAFGAAFKAAREARLSGKGGDTFEFGGKKYHSYQAGEKRPNAGSATPAASAAKPAAAAVPATSNEPPLSDTERKAIQREKDIGRTGTVALNRDQVLDKFSNDLKIGADKRAGERKFDSRGVIQKKPQDSSRFSDTKVFTTTTRTPGENSTVTTRNGGTTSTVQTSGGGTTEIKLNDTRTEAEKASDEAKATAKKNEIIATAKKNYAARQKSPPSVNESIESYKGAFRAVLAEATASQQTPPKQTILSTIKKYGPSVLRATPGFAAGAAAGTLAYQGAKTALSAFDATNTEKAKEQGKDLKAAALDRGVPLTTAFATGDATQSLVNRAVNRLSGVRNAPITGRAVLAGGTRAAAVGGAETLANYLERKAEKDPSIEQPVKRATPIIRGLGYGYGIAGAPGAAVGGLIGAVKSGTEGMEYEYKNKLTDQERSNMRSRGIARFGFNPYERLDAEIAAEKKKREAAARPPAK